MRKVIDNIQGKLSLLVLLIICCGQATLMAQDGSVPSSSLTGSWKLVSYELEFQDTGEKKPVWGSNPHGYLIFGSDGRMMAYLEADGRKAPTNDGERSAAFQTLIAYTGKYIVQGNKWITQVDAAWNVEWEGTRQERFFTLAGDRLSVVAQWNPNQLFNRRLTRGHLTFEREKSK